MDYHSDVGLAISNKLVNLSSQEDIAALAEIFGMPTAISIEGDYFYMLESVKWYNSDYKIGEVIALIADWDDENRNEFLFIELGEDYSDVTEAGSWYSNPFEFGWVRKLVFEFPKLLGQLVATSQGWQYNNFIETTQRGSTHDHQARAD